MRHSRGYGVHSPFLYGVVRQAMMPRRVVGGPTQLHSDLQAAGIDKRTATRLQNYLYYVGLSEWTINKVPPFGAEDMLMIATPDCPADVLKQMMSIVGSEEHNTKATLCVIHRRGKTSKRLRRRLVAEHKGMSAEKRHFTLLFFNPALPKQHIII